MFFTLQNTEELSGGKSSAYGPPTFLISFNEIAVALQQRTTMEELGVEERATKLVRKMIVV